MRNKKFMLVAVLMFTFLLGGCTSSKYAPGRDTLACFGDDAKYQIWRVPPYTLENLETDQIIEPVVQKYYKKGKYAYFVGLKGYTVIELDSEEIQQGKNIDLFSEQHKDVFYNKNFKKIQEEEFIELTLDRFTTENQYVFLSGQLYLGYSPTDAVTKDFLTSNKNDIINKTFKEWFASHEESWMNAHGKDDFQEYLNERFPEVSIEKMYMRDFASGHN